MRTLRHRSILRMAHRCMCVVMLLCLLSSQAAWAVSGGEVKYGPATIQAPAGNTAGGMDYNVNLGGGSSVIHWADLNTGALDNLNFANGPAVLNRVFQAVDFQGRLNANGVRVYIVSPNGIHIGSSAVITARQFIASGLDISNQDFLKGVDQFEAFQVGDGFTAIGQVQNDGTIQVADKAALLGSKVLNKGTISSDGGLILLASGDRILLGEEGSDIVVKPAVYSGFQIDSGEKLNAGDVANKGKLNNSGGPIVLAAGDPFVQALGNLDSLSLKIDGNKGNARQFGTIETSGGDVVLSAAGNVIVEAGSSINTEGAETPGDVTLVGSNVKINEALDSAGDLTVLAEHSVIAGSDLASGGDMTVESVAKGTYIGGHATAGDDLSVSAGTFISLDGDLDSGGDMTLTAKAGTSTLGNLIADGDVTLNTDLYLGGGEWVYDEGISEARWEGDQEIASFSGTVTAEGMIQKVTPGELFIYGGGMDEGGVSVSLNNVFTGGNQYIYGVGDVQLAGDLDAARTLPIVTMPEGPHLSILGVGGVAVISETGSIYSPGSDAVEVGIIGYSNEFSWTGPIGVDLPFGDEDAGKAAISLVSRETLTIGDNAQLFAGGSYLPASEENPEMGVDNRPGVDLLAEDAAIGGYDRDQGVASDVAIYLASLEGNVEIRTPYISVSPDVHLPTPGFEPINYGPATVVFDAYDTVIMSFLGGDVTPYDYRLEVVSRVTEWLGQAVANGTLPMADDPESMKALYLDYVLRGAGDYPDYPDTRAWVLADEPAAPVAPPLASLEIPEISGCPVELEAAAAELGISADALQISIGNSLALNPNLNACEACSRLVRVARVLSDENGLRMAAMNQIFNTIAPADAPFTPEVQNAVMTAFADLESQDSPFAEPGRGDRQYALAGEYVDAFVEYVAIVETELKAPVGDTVALLLNKYGSSLMGAENPNISAFVLSQLQIDNTSL